jgi:hypothetical protein
MKTGFSVFLTGALLALCGICRADTIGIALTSGLLSGPPGSALTFNGTLSNLTGSTVFLNSAGINLAGAFIPADEDTSPFFMNAPLSLAGNGATPSIDLFTIAIPSPFAFGAYAGTFTVLGGANANSQDTLGSASFTVQVGSAAAAPEPGTWSLFIAASFALLVFRALNPSRKRKRP